MSFSSYFTNKKGGDRIFSVEAPKIKFGRGSLKEIGDDARALGMNRVAVFTDPKVAQLEPVAKVVESLKSKGMDTIVYDEVAVEPTDISFKQGSKFASEGKFDGFVSVGGGLLWIHVRPQIYIPAIQLIFLIMSTHLLGKQYRFQENSNRTLHVLHLSVLPVSAPALLFSTCLKWKQKPVL
ncbi:MAG: hypothetical protein CM1200mP30_32060 [Pseudomonadota bacterium]|nr:MAG: hypothetical protein CM1200mP30_32060 [Pseudomonadota bacterium]